MPRMGRYTDEAKDHSRTGSAANRDEYVYDAVGIPMTLAEERLIDPHVLAGGTRGDEAGLVDAPLRRRHNRPRRSPTWHDTLQSDDAINYDPTPTGQTYGKD